MAYRNDVMIATTKSGYYQIADGLNELTRNNSWLLSEATVTEINNTVLLKWESVKWEHVLDDEVSFVEGTMFNTLENPFDFVRVGESLGDVEYVSIGNAEELSCRLEPQVSVNVFDREYLHRIEMDDAVPYRGTCGNCTWEINNEGQLTIAPIEGTDGKLAEFENYWYIADQFGWLDHGDKIFTATIEPGVTAPKSCAGMFSRCTSLTEINLSNFNTENVTTITGMFSDCTSLTTLDLSNFNTENVTSMRTMFSSCKDRKSTRLNSSHNVASRMPSSA